MERVPPGKSLVQIVAVAAASAAVRITLTAAEGVVGLRGLQLLPLHTDQMEVWDNEGHRLLETTVKSWATGPTDTGADISSYKSFAASQRKLKWLRRCNSRPLYMHYKHNFPRKYIKKTLLTLIPEVTKELQMFRV